MILSPALPPVVLLDRSPAPLTAEIRAAALGDPAARRAAGWRDLPPVDGVAVRFREDPEREEKSRVMAYFMPTFGGKATVRFGSLPPEIQAGLRSVMGRPAGTEYGPDTRVALEFGLNVALQGKNEKISMTIWDHAPPSTTDEMRQGTMLAVDAKRAPWIGPSVARKDVTVLVERRPEGTRGATVGSRALALLEAEDAERQAADDRLRRSRFESTELGRRMRPGGEDPLGGPESRKQLELEIESQSYRFKSPEEARDWLSGARIADRRIYVYFSVLHPLPGGGVAGWSVGVP